MFYLQLIERAAFSNRLFYLKATQQQFYNRVFDLHVNRRIQCIIWMKSRTFMEITHTFQLSALGLYVIAGYKFNKACLMAKLLKNERGWTPGLDVMIKCDIANLIYLHCTNEWNQRNPVQNRADDTLFESTVQVEPLTCVSFLCTNLYLYSAECWL